MRHELDTLFYLPKGSDMPIEVAMMNLKGKPGEFIKEAD